MKADKKLKLRVSKKKIQDRLDYQGSAETKMGRSRRSKKAGRIGQIISVILLSVVFLFCVLNLNYLTPSKMKEHMSAVFADMGKGEGFPYKFSANEVRDFFSFNGSDYVVLTNSELIILNCSAKPVLTYQHSMSNPIAKYSSDRILLYDQGSTKAVILNQSGRVLSFPNDDKIICADISGSGKSVIATNTSGQKQTVNVYSSAGKKLMSWSKGSGYIIDTALNSSGSMLAVGLIDTVDAVETVTVLSFSVSTAEQKGHTEFKDTSLYDLTYSSSNDLLVLCNNKISVLNTKCAVKKEAELPSMNNVQLFADRNGHIINVYSKYNNGTYTADVYNSALKNIYSKECSGEIKRVNCDGTSLSVLFADNHAELNMLGGKVTYSAKCDTEGSLILSKGKAVYICSNGLIERVKVSKK